MTTSVPATAVTGKPGKSRFLKGLLRQPVAVASAVFMLTVIAACLLAPWLSPFDPLAQDLADVYGQPSAAHWLGTDRLGRDILSRLLVGGQTTLLGALQAVLVSGLLGIVLGITAGSYPRTVDRLIMWVCDILQSIPGLIILLVVLAIFNQNESAAMITLGILVAPGLVRIVRGATMAVRAEQYVAAARVAGLSETQVQVRHVLPAIGGPVLTQVSIIAAVAILVEAGIGFLGLGVAPPSPTWGNMISDAQAAVGLNPWMLIPTGGLITLVSLALTLLGNGIRDAYAGKSTRIGSEISWHTLAAKVLRRQEKAGGQQPSDIVPDAVAPLLSVHGMTIELPVGNGFTTIVDNVSFDIAPGEAVGIVGESGCGKSISVAGVLRVLPPGARLSARSMTFDGLDLLTLNEKQMNDIRGSGIAYISQEPISSLDPAFTAGQQITEAIRQHRKISRKAARALALELFAQVRLPNPEEVYNKYPHELSGGMAQRVAITRALAGRPRLLIADEPTTALDVTVQADILDLLRDLREQTGMAVILVTHDWGVLADACDRTLVMYAGQVVESAPLRAITTRATHPYSNGLLLATPANVEPGQPLPAIEGTVPAPGTWPSGCRFASRCQFAQTDCTLGPIPLIKSGPRQESRCIHTEDLLKEEEIHERATVA